MWPTPINGGFVVIRSLQWGALCNSVGYVCQKWFYCLLWFYIGQRTHSFGCQIFWHPHPPGEGGYVCGPSLCSLHSIIYRKWSDFD